VRQVLPLLSFSVIVLELSDSKRRAALADSGREGGLCCGVMDFYRIPVVNLAARIEIHPKQKVYVKD
jgi:hypothetical protein